MAYSKIRKALRKVAGNDILIVVYGTTKLIYNKTTDLDVCVYKQHMSDAEKNRIAKTVESFHKDNNMRIDTDMSFINKTAFDECDFEALEHKPPFDSINDKIMFNHVQFTPVFLDSKEMRLRLFLNIFTTKTRLIYGDPLLYKRNIARMYNILVSYILRATEPSITLPKALDLIFGTDDNYKTFLGYNNNKQQRNYVTERLSEAWFNYKW